MEQEKRSDTRGNCGWQWHHFKACDIWKVLLGVLIGLLIARAAFGVPHFKFWR